MGFSTHIRLNNARCKSIDYALSKEEIIQTCFEGIGDSSETLRRIVVILNVKYLVTSQAFNKSPRDDSGNTDVVLKDSQWT